jgi:integrase
MAGLREYESRLYTKKPGGTWYGTYYELDGKRVQVCLKTADRTAAALRLRELARQAAAGLSKNKTPVAPLSAVLERYLARVERRGRATSTVVGYVRCAGHLIRVLGESTDVNSFKPSVEDDYIDVRRAEGAADHTIHKELTVLRASLRVAKKDGMFVGDRDVLRADDFSAHYQPRKTFLTPAQLTALLQALPPARRATIAFIVYTGARDGEWPLVCREHVDLDGLLVLPGTKTRRAHRALPLADHPPLRALLECVLSFVPVGPLFARWSNIRRDLQAACTAAGIPRVSPNDLRRTFGTWCRIAGMPTDRIAVLLGHADARMVERVYGKLDPAHMGPEIRAVFSGLALPALPETGSSRVTDGERTRGRMGQMTPAPSVESLELAVPRVGIEPTTRGFSVLCSTN